VDEHLWALTSGGTAHPYQLGSLATAWPRIAVTTSPEELRAVLVASPWGDPGDARPETVRLSLRLSWLRRLAVTSPSAPRSARYCASFSGDASDADAEVATRMRAEFAPWPTAMVIDTSGPLPPVLDVAVHHVGGVPRTTSIPSQLEPD
jgi:hypothetical protein